MIEGIKSIQRERAECVLTDAQITYSIESGFFRDLLCEGECPSDSELYCGDGYGDDLDDPKLLALLDQVPEDSDDSEIIDRIVNSEERDMSVVDLVSV